MDDYISRKVLTEAFENADADVCESFPDGYCDWGFGRQRIREVIASVPTGDLKPIRHGYWKIRRSSESDLRLECSVCGRRIESIGLRYLLEAGSYGEACRRYPYCHCGAKMKIERGRRYE